MICVALCYLDNMKIFINQLNCKRCGYVWTPRKSDIRICPKCKSAYRDREKKCKKCQEEKSLSEFQVRPCMKDGYRSDCKACVAHRNRIRYLANAESAKKKQREWNANNKEAKKKSAHEWYKNNKDRAYELNKKWIENNPEKSKEYQKKGQVKYAQSHKEELRKKRIEKYAEDPMKFRNRHSKWKEKDIEKARLLSRIASQKIRDTPRGTLNDRISAGIRQSLKGSKSGQKWESLVGVFIK